MKRAARRRVRDPRSDAQQVVRAHGTEQVEARGDRVLRGALAPPRPRCAAAKRRRAVARATAGTQQTAVRAAFRGATGLPGAVGLVLGLKASPDSVGSLPRAQKTPRCTPTVLPAGQQGGAQSATCARCRGATRALRTRPPACLPSFAASAASGACRARRVRTRAAAEGSLPPAARFSV